MNLLLSINKKIIFVLFLIIVTLMLFFLIFKYILILEKNNSEEKFELSKVDITEPRFAINNPSQKIFITAKEGNFVDDSKILLRKNVIFESKNFKIQSDDVIFDKKNLQHIAKKNLYLAQKILQFHQMVLIFMIMVIKLNLMGNL
mgnify:CR=1 FL=1